MPIAIVSAFIMIFAPYLKWHDNKKIKSLSRSFLSFSLSLLCSLYVYFSHPDKLSLISFFGVLLGLWLILSLLEVLFFKYLKQEKLGRGYVAMCISHIGFGLLVLSITLLHSFELEREQIIAENSSSEFFNYNVKINSSEIKQEKNYIAQSIDIEIQDKNGKKVGNFKPENRIYFPSAKKTTEADVKYELFGDYYVVAGESELEGLEHDNKTKQFTVNFYFKPFMSFVWLSVIIFVLGAVISIKPKQNIK